MITRCRGIRAGSEMRQRRAAAVIGAVEIRRDEIVEPVLARVAAVRAAETTARDERVNRAELAGGRGERLLHLAALADVARRDVGRPVERRGRLLEPVAAAREQRQRGALAVEPARDRPPDSGPGTGDDDVTMGIRSHVLLQTIAICGKDRIDRDLMLDPAAA